MCKDCASKAICLTRPTSSGDKGRMKQMYHQFFFRMAWRTRFYTSSSSLVNVATDSLDIWTEVAIRFFRAISSIFISTSHADGRSGGGTVGSRRYCKTIGSEPPKCRFTSSGICWNAIVSEPKIYTKHDNDQAEMKRTP